MMPVTRPWMCRRRAHRHRYVFRVNRDLVVLNDVNSGNVWLVNQNMQLVNNWDDVIPPQQTIRRRGQGLRRRGLQQTVLPDRTKPNSAPGAKPDTFGVRAGKTTILPVLDNDTDPDGDILTVRSPDPPALRRPRADLRRHRLPGQRPGRRKTGSGNVQIHGGRRPRALRHRRRHPQHRRRRGRTAAPRQKPNRNTTLVVQGKIVSQNILTDWIDPDGDDLFARSAPGQQRPRTRSRSGPTACSASRTPAPTRARSRHRHGLGRTLHRRRQGHRGRPAAGALPPIANADHVVAVAGVDTVITPLKNDFDPQAEPSASPRSHQPAPPRWAPDPRQTFTFNSTAHGPIYVSYLVTNGPASSQAGPRRRRLRQRRRRPGGRPRRALLPTAAACWWILWPTIPILPAACWCCSPSSRRIRDRLGERARPLRRPDHRRPVRQGPLIFIYTISNGRSSATGRVSVVRPGTHRSPGTTGQTGRSQRPVNDVVTIPVLDNDTDPNGGKLTLDPVLAQPHPRGRRPDLHFREDSALHRRRRAKNRLRHLQSRRPSGPEEPRRSPSASSPRKARTLRPAAART